MKNEKGSYYTIEIVKKKAENNRNFGIVVVILVDFILMLYYYFCKIMTIVKILFANCMYLKEF